MLIRGLDTSKVTDGVDFVLPYPFVIQTTYSYTAVSGAQKTVLVLECKNAKVDEAIENARFRTWKVGKDVFRGKLVELMKGKVRLERKDDHKLVEVPVYRLSKKDQKYVREEAKHRPVAANGTKPKQPQAQVAGIATAKPVDTDGTAKDDRLRYIDPTYGETILRVNGKWQVVNDKTGRVIRIDDEVSRTKDWVELYSPSRKEAFRLLPQRIEQKINDKWQWVANGHWERNP
jgi:hypothetical protein